MAKQIIICVMAFILISSSCKENKRQDQSQVVEDENISPVTEMVYLYSENKDTVLMILENKDNIITGKLDFLPYEKDSRRGTIKNGQVKGDTLFAIYHSVQEGQETECEVAFLKKNNNYILSNDIFGENNYQYNADYTKGSFKNKNIIKFDGEVLTISDKK